MKLKNQMSFEEKQARSVESTMREAVGFHQRGQTQEALGLYENVLRQEPEHADALYLAGSASAQTGHLDEAENFLRRAVSVRPDHAPSLNNLGNVLREISVLVAEDEVCKLHEQARTACEAALRLRPDYAEAHSSLGIVLYEMKALDEAESSLRRAVEINPAYASAWSKLGGLLNEREDGPGAVDCYRRAIKLNPNVAEFHASFGAALYNIGDLKEALQAFDGALSLDPKEGFALAYKALTLEEMGEDEKAREIVDIDRYVRPVRLRAPAAYEDMAAFNKALLGEIRGASLKKDPKYSNIRNGLKTDELEFSPGTALGDLQDLLDRAVEEYMDLFPYDPGHPFLSVRPKRYRRSGWANMLGGESYFYSHIHSPAWLSLSYYVKLPKVVFEETQNHEGWIEFGKPDESFRARNPRVKVFQPEEGLCFMFPSFYFHRTIAYRGAEERIGIPFNLYVEA